MAGSDVTRNLRDGVLKLKDGTTPTPQSLTVVLEAGDLRWTETHPHQEVLDRGVLDHWKRGPDTPVSVEFTIMPPNYQNEADSSGSLGSVRDFLRKLGDAAENVSTHVCDDVYAIDLEFTIVNPCSDVGKDEVITFADFVMEGLEYQEGDPSNTMRVTGRALVTEPTVTHV